MCIITYIYIYKFIYKNLYMCVYTYVPMAGRAGLSTAITAILRRVRKESGLNGDKAAATAVKMMR